MRLERSAGAKSWSALWVHSKSSGSHGRVLAEAVTCSNLESEEHSGSCVEAGAGTEAGGLVEGGCCTSPDIESRWCGDLG